MSQSLVIPAEFNGPMDSGNGGYSAGAVAAFLGGPAAVSLRRSVPLDAPLDVAVEDGAARVFDGDELIAEGESAPGFEIETPEVVGIEEAREASTHYRGLLDGPFSRCFVCGRSREDALEVFAGPVAAATSSPRLGRRRPERRPIAVDGRKRRAGSAVISAEGEILAVAEALLIEPRQD